MVDLGDERGGGLLRALFAGGGVDVEVIAHVAQRPEQAVGGVAALAEGDADLVVVGQRESTVARGFGEWGNRCFRSFAAGTPALLAVQAATGASRPGETNAESDWVPIRYLNKGVARVPLMGFFRNSAIGLVTPVRDGMNLVAQEYVLCQAAEAAMPETAMPETAMPSVLLP